MVLFTRFRIAFGICIGLCLGIAGTTFAASNSNEIKFCVSKTTGVVRMIAAGRCSSREKLIVVNQRGIQGLPGEQGVNGANGTAGTNGSAGVNGANGTAGTNGSTASMTCAQGGACALGDTGPGGGIVYYKASTSQWWGQYLEVAPVSWFGGSIDPEWFWCDAASPADDTTNHPIPGGTQGNTSGVKATDIGMGWANSERIARHCATGAAVMTRMYHGGGKSDWYLPTSDELAEMCAYFGEAATTQSGVPAFAGNKSCEGISWNGVDLPTTTRGRSSGFTTDESYWTSTEYVPSGVADCGYSVSNGLTTNYLDCAILFHMMDSSDPATEYLLAGPKTMNKNRVRPIRAFG